MDFIMVAAPVLIAFIFAKCPCALSLATASALRSLLHITPTVFLLLLISPHNPPASMRTIS